MTRDKIIQRITDVAVANGIDPAIGIAQARQESSFNPNAVSSAGAQGLFQFMPGTWTTYGNGSPFDSEQSIQAWARYMRKLLNQFGGRYDLALAGYNSGENRSEYKNAAAENRAINWSVMPAGVQRETKNYVERILASAGKGNSFDAASFESGNGIIPAVVAGILILWLIN